VGVNPHIITPEKEEEKNGKKLRRKRKTQRKRDNKYCLIQRCFLKPSLGVPPPPSPIVGVNLTANVRHIFYTTIHIGIKTTMSISIYT